MEPLVSVICAARNDDYGGDFLERLRWFLSVLLAHADRHSLSAEVVVVEWNPPQDRPRLPDVLASLRPSVSLRIIEVPPPVHARLDNPTGMPMFEYMAKNVGLRRARGRFGLVTNPDLLFTHELIRSLSTGLREDAFYRIDRYDFEGPVPVALSPDEAVAWAKRRVFQVAAREVKPGIVLRGVSSFRRWLSERFDMWPGSLRGRLTTTRGGEPAVPLEDGRGKYWGLHTNASGDFTLAPIEAWRAVRGFLETSETSTHIDSYGVLQLSALGLRQWLFLPPCMALHAAHGRAEQSSRPRTSEDKWMTDLMRIRQGELGPALNGPGWGLEQEDLPETELVADVR